MSKLEVGQIIEIKGGHQGNPMAKGRVTKLNKKWATVETILYAGPVRYRLDGPLKGRRITGGLAEHLNDYIEV